MKVSTPLLFVRIPSSVNYSFFNYTNGYDLVACVDCYDIHLGCAYVFDVFCSTSMFYMFMVYKLYVWKQLLQIIIWSSIVCSCYSTDEADLA